MASPWRHGAVTGLQVLWSIRHVFWVDETRRDWRNQGDGKKQGVPHEGEDASRLAVLLARKLARQEVRSR
jgi:hypothetical protein